MTDKMRNLPSFPFSEPPNDPNQARLIADVELAMRLKAEYSFTRQNAVGVACSPQAFQVMLLKSIDEVLQAPNAIAGIPLAQVPELRWDAVGIDAITFYDTQLMQGFFNRIVIGELQDTRWVTFVFDVFGTKENPSRAQIYVTGNKPHEDYTAKDLAELERPLEFYGRYS